MRKINWVFLIGILLVLIVTPGCIRINFGATNGGVFKSNDSGDGWDQKTRLLTLNKQEDLLSSADVTVLVMDPQDSKTLYIGTRQDGVFMSYDGAESWLKIKNLPDGQINTIAVNPRASHIVYLAIGNRLFKSVDCARSWSSIYLEAAPRIVVSHIAIDPTESNKVYMGISDGRILKSEDGGINWLMVANFKGNVRQILINPKNPEIIYAATTIKGLWMTSNGGQDWQSLDGSLKDFPGGKDVGKLVFDPVRPSSLISANDYGLLRTDDNGQSWSDYKLLIPRGRTKIYSFTINPQNPNILYYATTSTFYKSVDNGKTWTTKSMPNLREPVELLIDQINPSILYLGSLKQEK